MVISQYEDDVGPISGGEVWFPVSLVDNIGVVAVGPRLLAGAGADCDSQDDEECDGDEGHVDVRCESLVKPLMRRGRV